MVTAVNATSTTTSTLPSSNGSATIGKDATEDRFLKLLIAQMKNQDPLNPLDNAQVTSQMAQINTVQGISQLNASMASMLSQLQGAQAMALTGHQVLVDGNSLTLSRAGDVSTAKGGFALTADADRVTVDIKDEKGNVIKQLNLSAQTAGPGVFVWDGSIEKGLAPAGKYTFDVKAYNGSASVPVSTLTAARVDGSAMTAQGVRLTLEGLGIRYYSDVHMVL